MPQRIQQKRTRGWRKPEGAVAVGRGTKWGNPYVVHQHTDTCDRETCPLDAASDRARAALMFRHAVLYPVSGQPEVPTPDEIRVELAGRDLMCWCPLPEPGQPDHCHAAVLLELANPPSEEA